MTEATETNPRAPEHEAPAGHRHLELPPDDSDEEPRVHLPRGAPRDEVYKSIADRYTADPDRQAERGVPRVAPAPEPEPEPVPEAQEEMVRVGAFGQHKMVPASEIEAAGGFEAYQKLYAIDVKMQETKREAAAAKKARQEVDRYKEELAKMLDASRERERGYSEEGPARAEPAPRQDAFFGPDGLTEQQREYLKKLSEDYDDEFVATRRDLFLVQNQSANQPKAQAPDDPALVKRLAEMVRQENEQREMERRQQSVEEQREAANEYFSANYSEIERDEDLALVAKRHIQKAFAADPNRPLIDIVKEAGDHVRKRFGIKPSQSGAVKEGDAMNERIERKRTNTPPRSTASDRFKPPSNEPPAPPTSSEVIASFKRARGQPV